MTTDTLHEMPDDDSSIVKHASPADNSGIVVEFHRYIMPNSGLGGTAVIFKIPDSAQILSRDPAEFMKWCYEQMMTIGEQARRMK